ncbi:MAG: hypothetical protein IJ428_04335 [Clostridia bacterium]|nr:hypothetical protein [Clostridia bacterium]
MNFECITKNGVKSTALGMYGQMSEPFVPLCVRGPNFHELNDGTIVYSFGMKYTSRADEAPGCGALHNR